jgi:hypothetical protein
MEYQKEKRIVEYDSIRHREYIVKQLESLGLEVTPFKYISHVSVSSESWPKDLEEKIMAIELEGKNIVRNIRRAGVIKAIRQ